MSERSNVTGTSPRSGSTKSIVDAYDSLAVKLYSLIRFRIVRPRILQEVGQYLPREGRALEVGCGFGLFGLHFALSNPELHILGFDIDAHRIGLADEAKRRLGVDNIEFSVGDAREAMLGSDLDAIYMFDVIHHIPPPSAFDLMKRSYEALGPDGVLLVKDVDTRPRLKTAFTWLLDVLMTKGERPTYWSSNDLIATLEGLGFSVRRHTMVDSLPYPHVLLVASKHSA